MEKRILALILAVIMTCSMVGCGNAANQNDGKEDKRAENFETKMQTFTDDCGREVEFPAELTKIAPSGPISQIVLYPIVADLFAGIGYHWGEEAKGFVDQKYYCVEEQGEMKFHGQLYGAKSLNIEDLAATNPQVIIDIGDAKASLGEDMDALTEQTKIPGIHISCKTLKDMPEVYRTLGKLFGREERGEELAKTCERIYGYAEEVLNKVGDNKVKALYFTNAVQTSVLAKTSFHGELIDLLTDNVAVLEDVSGKGAGNEVNMDQIALWNPDVIIFDGASGYEEVIGAGTWQQLSAISSGRYICAPIIPHNWIGSPTAVNRFLGLILLTAELYPEYAEYDVKEEVTNFYKVFYDYEMTDGEYEDLMKDVHFAK